MFECKVCKVSKTRVNGPRRSDDRGFSKVDDSGSRWNGHTCPSCTAEQATPQALYGPATVLYPPKLRACRNCKTMNPNYFECDGCRSEKAAYGCLEESMYGLELGHGNPSNGMGFRY